MRVNAARAAPSGFAAPLRARRGSDQESGERDPSPPHPRRGEGCVPKFGEQNPYDGRPPPSPSPPAPPAASCRPCALVCATVFTVKGPRARPDPPNPARGPPPAHDARWASIRRPREEGDGEVRTAPGLGSDGAPPRARQAPGQPGAPAPGRIEAVRPGRPKDRHGRGPGRPRGFCSGSMRRDGPERGGAVTGLTGS